MEWTDLSALGMVKGTMPSARFGHTMAAVGSDIYLFGGYYTGCGGHSHISPIFILALQCLMISSPYLHTVRVARTSRSPWDLLPPSEIIHVEDARYFTLGVLGKGVAC